MEAITSDYAVLLWLPLLGLVGGCALWLTVLIVMQNYRQRDQARVARGELRWSQPNRELARTAAPAPVVVRLVAYSGSGAGNHASVRSMR